MNKHYKKSKYQPREIIKDWDLGFNLGNVVKYIARSEHKGNKEADLKKAIEYLKFELEEMDGVNKKNKRIKTLSNHLLQLLFKRRTALQ